MTRSKKNYLLPALAAVITVVAALFILLTAKPAYAGVVYPSGEGLTSSADRRAIQDELDETGSVTLVSGKTYYVSSFITVSSNQKIIANGATIICDRNLLLNIPTTANYNAIKNFSIEGGTWIYPGLKDGIAGSSIKITHGQNITFKNMTIRHANAAGHSIELVACKNVTISGCNIACLGSSDKKTEEAIQIDIATAKTAPFLSGAPYETSLASTLQNGATCADITVENCYIIGNRGVVANYTDGYLNKLHTNITLRGNYIKGLKGEGVALFNTSSATVTGNTIYSAAAGSADAYTIGLHLQYFGTGSGMESGKITISNNTVKGGRQALQLYAKSAKYGTVSVSGNYLYCKAGAGSAIKLNSGQCKSQSVKSNGTYGWNGAISAAENAAFGWIQQNGNWYCYSSGITFRKGWQQIGSKWYLFAYADGHMLKYWQKAGGKWYYLNGSGVMQTGWQKLGGKWYFFNSSGQMLTGWVQTGGKWYYFNSSGAMQTYWQKIGGKWYYFTGGGAMVTGWLKTGNKWYYFNNDGSMVTGRKTINSKTYYFDSSGAMTTSRTIYVTRTGKKYHYDNNCNGGTYYASTLDDAKARGLTPCEKCVHD